MQDLYVNETLGARDLPAVRELLVAADLPTDDIEDPSITFLGVREDGTLLGVVGLQQCGDASLLRSLAVRSDARTRGLGRALTEQACALADGEVYLLTTSAAAYFPRLGFRAISRDAAPPAIRATAQFAALCPASAVVMRRAK